MRSTQRWRFVLNVQRDFSWKMPLNVNLSLKKLIVWLTLEQLRVLFVLCVRKGCISHKPINVIPEVRFLLISPVARNCILTKKNVKFVYLVILRLMMKENAYLKLNFVRSMNLQAVIHHLIFVINVMIIIITAKKHRNVLKVLLRIVRIIREL